MKASFRILIPLILAASALTAGAEEPVSFRRDIQAILSKSGCNQGTCHGNLHGKGGFTLSLRGEDDAFDYAALTRGQFGRRVDLLRPEQSLLLDKATGQVPHGGGQRFAADSLDFALLCRWIAEGAADDGVAAPRVASLTVSPTDAVVAAPQDRIQLRVVARFQDGTDRDVTRWALFIPSQPIVTIDDSGTVTREQFGETTIVVRYLNRQAFCRLAWVPERPGFTWRSDVQPFNFIDRHVLDKLRRMKFNQTDVAPDHVFLRRVYLDLLGLPPTADEARAFVDITSISQGGGQSQFATKTSQIWDSPQLDRRSQLIDALVERPEFADHWALKWSDLLRNEEKTLDRKGVQNFHEWLRRAFADNLPLDELARQIVAAKGSTYTRPATNFYRANRDPVSRAEAVAQVFLGVRLQCAKCHNHPFDRWTQDDYYSWTSPFARVQYKIIAAERKDKNDLHEFDGEQLVWAASAGAVNHPRTGEPAVARFLGAETLAAEGSDVLVALADWLTAPENPYFARMQVNRVWYHLLGRGLVDPIDDARATNPPSHPDLLDELTREFIAHGYDLRWLVRLICNSRTYQITSAALDSESDNETNYARTIPRPLSAEQLLDAIHQVTETQSRFNGYPVGMRAGQLPGVMAVRDREETPSLDDRFLRQFGKPPRLLTCECERPAENTLAQTFQLISGPAINELLTRADNRLGKLLNSGHSDEAIIAELGWWALGRPLSSDESESLGRYLRSAGDRRKALEDIVWSLLNSKEFLLRP